MIENGTQGAGGNLGGYLGGGGGGGDFGGDGQVYYTAGGQAYILDPNGNPQFVSPGGPSTPSGAPSPGTPGGIPGPSGATPAAVPATASSVPSWLAAAAKISPALAAWAAGNAQGNLAQASASNNYDKNAVSLYQAELGNNTSQNAFNLATANLGLEAPGMRAKSAVQGDILANAQDATVSGVPSNIPVPTISGGLRPSMFSPATRALGGAMSTQALAGQQASTTPTIPTWQAGPAPPTLTPLPNGSAASDVATGASIFNIANQFYNGLKQYQPVGTTPPVQAPNSYIYA